MWLVCSELCSGTLCGSSVLRVIRHCGMQGINFYVSKPFREQCSANFNHHQKTMSDWNAGGGVDGGDALMDDWGDAYYTGNNGTVPPTSDKNTDSIILPVTIRDLANLEVDQDDRILLGNKQFSTVRIMGRVAQVEEADDGQTLRYILADLVHDEAQFNLIHYEGILSSGERRAPPFKVMDRLSVVGKVRRYDGELCVVAFDVKPLTDMKAMDAFHLQAKLARLYYIKNVEDLVASGMTSSLDGCMFQTTMNQNAPTVFSPLKTTPNGQTPRRVAPTNQQHTPSKFRNNAPQVALQRNRNVTASIVVSRKDENFNSNSPAKRTIPSMNPKQGGLVGQKAEIYKYMCKCGVSAEGEFIEDIRENVPSHMYSEHTFNSDLKDLAADGLIMQAQDDEHFVVNRAARG